MPRQLSQASASSRSPSYSTSTKRLKGNNPDERLCGNRLHDSLLFRVRLKRYIARTHTIGRRENTRREKKNLLDGYFHVDSFWLSIL